MQIQLVFSSRLVNNGCFRVVIVVVVVFSTENHCNYVSLLVVILSLSFSYILFENKKEEKICFVFREQ